MDRKKKMKKWLKKFENDMAAAAFAEAGEFETAREMLKEERKILLALTGQKSDANAFKYAINMCKRIGAKLDILLSKHHKENEVKEFKSELQKESIDHEFIEVGGCVKEEILNYTNHKSNILFVVLESSKELDIHCEKSKKVISESWKHLKCPLVVVSDLATA